MLAMRSSKDFQWNLTARASVRKKTLKATSKGQGLLFTIWKGWWALRFFFLLDCLILLLDFVYI